MFTSTTDGSSGLPGLPTVEEVYKNYRSSGFPELPSRHWDRRTSTRRFDLAYHFEQNYKMKAPRSPDTHRTLGESSAEKGEFHLYPFLSSEMLNFTILGLELLPVLPGQTLHL